MKGRLKQGEIRQLERRFWICTGIVSFVLLVLTILDSYFLGFK
jgi:hypothetical protein